ncbi:MAG: spore maturation protein [Bacteroidetes bacterium]|uniref:Spore maturation protein n=1 Tax=Candidatus Caccoplasma merdipullorum TaxID=2840718 RepID=A0A9D9E5H0_9BACT|nr:spore maturation protein [Candidatus Caccoplasma merdipullorum]
MVLNYIWLGFFFVAFIVAVIETVTGGNLSIWSDIMNSSFASAKTAFEISLGLTGVLSLWLGLMKIGERGGVISIFARLTSPFFSRLFPDIPKNSPVFGSIFMNFSANMLGLDNAATPLGLKAMREMQEINTDKETASNPMIMFLVLNTTGLTLVPISVMVYRAQMGAANPSDIFLPILIATYVSTLVGLIITCIKQRINLFDRVIISVLVAMTAIIGGILYFFSGLPQEKISLYSTVTANSLLFCIIIGFLVAGVRSRINVYDAFIDGAKEGFKTAVTIIPYLVAMLVAIAVFRASGAMDFLISGISRIVEACGADTDFVGALPTALMKPLSGSGARGMMVDAMATYGPDSFVARVASTIQGATDTTLYIIAVYFGSVGIKKTRYAAGYGLLADLAGIIAAIFVAYIFFK